MLLWTTIFNENRHAEVQIIFTMIILQPSPAKDFVIHLARTPQPAKKNVSEENLIINTDDDKEIAANNDRERKKKMANFTEIPESWVGDHAKHATRMLPGGMYVLGKLVSKQTGQNFIDFSIFRNFCNIS